MASTFPFLAVSAGLIAAFAAGCAGEQWAPPPPSGVTYQYDYQGFRERNTTVVAGSVGDGHGAGAAFAGVFSFRDDSELRGREVADPFAESSLIDGVSFNSHLGGEGIPLAPPPAASSSAAAPPEPAPPSSAWTAPPASAAPPAPTAPGGYL